MSLFFRTNWHEAMLREYETVTKRVGVADLSSFAKFVVSGPDATAFLNSLVAGRVPKKEGRASLVHALTEKEAKVYSELTVTRMEENRYMVITGAGSEGHDLRFIEQVMLIFVYIHCICR
jgi:dimethylglycine dehydrogenase